VTDRSLLICTVKCCTCFSVTGAFSFSLHITFIICKKQIRIEGTFLKKNMPVFYDHFSHWLQRRVILMFYFFIHSFVKFVIGVSYFLVDFCCYLVCLFVCVSNGKLSRVDSAFHHHPGALEAIAQNPADADQVITIV